jgi:hypothetical protein
MALISGDGGGGWRGVPYKWAGATTGKSPQAIAFERANAAAAQAAAARAEANRKAMEEARKRSEALRAAALEEMKAANARREALRAQASAEAAARSHAARQAGVQAAKIKANATEIRATPKPGAPVMDQFAALSNPLLKAAANSPNKSVAEKARQLRTGGAGGKVDRAAEDRAIAQGKIDRTKDVERQEKRAYVEKGLAAGRAKYLDPNNPYGKKFKTLDEWAAEAAAQSNGRYVGMTTVDENDNPTLDQSMLPVVDESGKIVRGGQTLYYKNPFQAPEFQEKDIWRYGQSRSNDTKWMSEWRKLIIGTGLVDDTARMSDEWNDVDAEVMGWVMARVNTSKWTDPMDYLRNMRDQGYINPNLLGDSTSSSSSGGGGGGRGGKSETLTQNVFNKTGLEDGRAILRAQMRQLLGREPSDGEVSQYVAALNAVEARTPEITTVTSTASGTTTRQVQSAPNPEEQLRRSVETGNKQENESYEGVQYYDVIQQMISGGGL